MKRQTESGRTLTIRINHNRSTALERSANIIGCGVAVGGGEGLNRFYVEKALALDSAVVQKHARYTVRMKGF